MDVGKYHENEMEYKKLLADMYNKYGEVTLSPEYGQFVQEDLLRLLIRLARYKFVARLVSKKDHVLEVGCGSGLGSIFMGQHAGQVTGLDVKQYELDEAERLNKRSNVNFIREDFFEFSEDQKFDVLVSLDVIEHFTPEMGEAFVKQMTKHLKPGGMVIIGSPSLYSYQYQSRISQVSHIKCYDQQELRDLMEKYFGRVLPFSMNDEIVHTGYHKMAWYYFMVATVPLEDK
ncbi:methyltransferase domain-containing protein [Lentisphaera marina]|uniref:class I SAM-dependent methyltransferase n=1 Tax=Lentisphaera marina TaxID=1111041 RepID=UPI002365C26C|nr:class I SAM-dependent methyltransferase [Lentisphaera marina]MDD7985729.1 methyltransferase domain-containing protein [Lentisphaera marina]